MTRYVLCCLLFINAGMAFAELHGDAWQLDSYIRLLGHEATLKVIREGRSVEDIEAAFETGLEDFRTRREQFLLYD